MLLGIGLLLIIVPLFQTYNIFTGISAAPEIFKSQKTQISQGNNLDVQQQLIEKALLNMIPVDSVSKSLNLTSWMLLAWTLIFGGSKLAGLGIRLL